jgi:hypothetical protein
MIFPGNFSPLPYTLLEKISFASYSKMPGCKASEIEEYRYAVAIIRHILERSGTNP